MPKLWNETVEGHRAAVREAILASTAALVAVHGLASVTMSQIAETAGIGRATLYKYFPDLDAVLLAWHERQVASHLAQLVEVRDHAGVADDRLAAVLEAYAHSIQAHQDAHLATLLHRGAHVTHAQVHL